MNLKILSITFCLSISIGSQGQTKCQIVNDKIETILYQYIEIVSDSTLSLRIDFAITNIPIDFEYDSIINSQTVNEEIILTINVLNKNIYFFDDIPTLVCDFNSSKILVYTGLEYFTVPVFKPKDLNKTYKNLKYGEEDFPSLVLARSSDKYYYYLTDSLVYPWSQESD